MYQVIHFFTDLQDSNYPYNVGDIFPRNGMQVSEERLKELSGNINKQHKPLIKKMKSKESQYEQKKYTKTEINRMPLYELQEVAFHYGIENAINMTGGELKRTLIEKLGL